MITKWMFPVSFTFMVLTGAFANLGIFEAKTTNTTPQEDTSKTTRPDSLPPLRERFDQEASSTTPKNPVDLADPKAVEKSVEYDPETGQYILREKMGEFDFRPPTYMSFDEYMKYREKKDREEYYERLKGTGGRGVGGLDPMGKIDIKSSIIDRLFGGTEVDIRPSGNIDMWFGYSYQNLQNPILPERSRSQLTPEFDLTDLRLDVTGKIGTKLNLNTSYDKNSLFDFDRKIKLDYASDLFNEDDIIKKIEAGNVSMPLKGSLIPGVQNLFGLKTDLQFGHLRLSGIVAQQQSNRESIKIERGAQTQEFEVYADEYDENRHFFLSHFNRSQYEPALTNLPQIRSLFRIENLEVWVTNDRQAVNDVRDIVAVADLGEPQRIANTQAVTPSGATNGLPDNKANNLYSKLLANAGGRKIDQVVNALQSPAVGLVQGRDFEKVNARKLNTSEYTFNPELGFVSLNVNIQADAVVGVAFQYSYNGQIFKVGELAANQENMSPDSTLNVLFVKMLKGVNIRDDIPLWDLMMKNVYSLGAYQVDPLDFKLDIYYDDPGKGQKRFITDPGLGIASGRPLMRVFNLDRLNTQGDPQPDGVFDFVPGLTINPQNGRIYFPVLEPFGSSLRSYIERESDPALTEDLIKKYTYPELYDRILFQAREFPEKNRFVVRGIYKSSVSSEINLGAFNLPQGSVRVTAGGQLLVEGQDYEVDYGIGRLRILNDAIVSSGVPIDISFEDNTLFGLQRKAMLGLRADYTIGENFNIGATAMKLFERPYTQKVNFGDDPINNNVYGLDLNFNRNLPWLTKALDALPLFSSSAESSITFAAEGALLKPGHSRAVNQNAKDKGGVVYIDDFEGSATGIDLRYPANQWYLASTPQNDSENNNPLFPESARVNELVYGANRGLLNWYRIDAGLRTNRNNVDAQSQRAAPYTSVVQQVEVFPNLNLPPDQLPNSQTFDLSYYPEERGPYNFDIPAGYPGFSAGIDGDLPDGSPRLRDPASRWGGVMRAMSNPDFQTQNIEFLEFWVLSPYLDPTNSEEASADGLQQQGELYINLGNISEDILRDSRKFFENGLPGPANPDRRIDRTNWSQIPVSQQITNNFDIDEATRLKQDVGLDGVDDENERIKFASYLSNFSGTQRDILSRDPSNDNFLYYNDNSTADAQDLRFRYKRFNNTQGNSQVNTTNDQLSAGTNYPDAEDINRDNTLNETESYYQYKVPFRVNPTNPREIDVTNNPYITDKLEDPNTRRIWYRMRIPLDDPNKVAVGGIRDFRSIRFMRMYMTGFEKPVTLRFARMELVRNQWRRYTQDLPAEDVGVVQCNANTTLELDAVNIEENNGRKPFSYVLPLGIQREQQLGIFSALQNEQSLVLNIRELCAGEAKAAFKQLNMDMRVYDRLRMFVHAEELDDLAVEDDELSVFVRLGSDFKNNYYEYEIPLKLSREDRLTSDINSPEYKQEVWRPENEFDFELTRLRKAKERRNSLGFPLGERYTESDTSVLGQNAIIAVRGAPNLGYVKMAMIGVRNRTTNKELNVTMWVNEMRLSGLDERGGGAAIARMDVQLADLGSLTVAGNYGGIGYGAIDNKVQERAREATMGYDMATTLQLDKFLPEKWGISLPMYAQVSKQIKTPEYDPYDLDIKHQEKVSRAASEDRDSLRYIAQEVNSLRSVTFNNVRKEASPDREGPPKPWSIDNFSLNYSFSEAERRDPLIEYDTDKRVGGGLDYGYSRQAKFIEPFKKLIKDDKYLKLITEFNFNPIPNSVQFSTLMNRQFNSTRYRDNSGEEPLDPKFLTFYNKRFTWDRNYNLQWDLTKALKFNFNATNLAVIDEPDELAIREDPTISDPIQYRKDSIWNNIRDLGRTKNYSHTITANYTVPINKLPFMDWVQVRGQYDATYSWGAAALNVDSIGNVIQNTQNRQASAELNFEGLYNKIPFIKDINRTGPAPKGGKAGPSSAAKAIIRPLLLVRRVRLNYTERFSTAVPGFMPQVSFLGMQQGFNAPGLGFVAGLQPRIRTLNESEYGTTNDWLFQNRQNISTNLYMNQEVVQDYVQNIDFRLTLEPFRDFRIEVEATKSFTENHTEYFKVTDPATSLVHTHSVPQKMGSLNTSYLSVKNIFQDDRQQILDLFRTFESYRPIISQRRGVGTHQDQTLAQEGYTNGYGRIQQDVIIPAFIAAYTDQDPNNVSLDLFDVPIRPNWRLSYNGLQKVPLFKDLFKSFNLNHAYKGSLTMNRFNTGLDYLANVGDPLNPLNYNFYPRLEVPEIVIQEAFAPLISVDATTLKGMNFKFDFKKSKTLALSMVSNQLSETHDKEITFGYGFIVKGVKIKFLEGLNKFTETIGKIPGGRGGGGAGAGGGPQLGNNDLNISLAFSLRDDITFNHLIDQQTIEPTRGNYGLRIEPAVEYRVNERISLRLFNNFSRNVPKTANGYPRTDSSGGLIFRFSLD